MAIERTWAAGGLVERHATPPSDEPKAAARLTRVAMELARLTAGRRQHHPRSVGN
jgi:hypothetical protein